MPPWLVGPTPIAGHDTRARIMGILNVTPDSFSDGGKFANPRQAIDHARLLIDQGADILDIGGESTRPGSSVISLDEELRRVMPVIEAISTWAIPLSIDTTKPEVARRALAAGASIVNDVNGLRDPEMLDVIAAAQASAVIMHMAGTPQSMQLDPHYNEVTREVLDWLARRVDAAVTAGIPLHNLAIDPGIGFGKTADHNKKLLRDLANFRQLDCALVIGTSRKRFLGLWTGRDTPDRLVASIASALAAVHNGADVVRVHDVAAMRDALIVWYAQARH